ncbi:MAG: DUF5050 domain-containing protein [Oscillospiraceae bacterium]|nr:DUF5050 domain-containing protein [Oscillospiraceae bacterium]
MNKRVLMIISAALAVLLLGMIALLVVPMLGNRSPDETGDDAETVVEVYTTLEEETTTAEETDSQPFSPLGQWTIFSENFPREFTRGEGYRFAAHYALSPTHFYMSGRRWGTAGTRIALDDINRRTNLEEWDTIAGITPQGLLVRVRNFDARPVHDTLYLIQSDGSRIRLAQGARINDDIWWAATEIWYNAASNSLLLITAFGNDSWQMEAFEFDTMQRHVIHTAQGGLEWDSHIWHNLDDGSVMLRTFGGALRIDENNRVLQEWSVDPHPRTVTVGGWVYALELPHELYRYRPDGTQSSLLRDDVGDILEVNGHLYAFIICDEYGFYDYDGGELILYRLDTNGNTVGEEAFRGYSGMNGGDYLLRAGNFILISRFVYGGGFGSHVVALYCPATQTLLTPERD